MLPPLTDIDPGRGGGAGCGVAGRGADRRVGHAAARRRRCHSGWRRDGRAGREDRAAQHAIPVQLAQEFTTYQVDGQSAMAIHVVQGEREMVEDCRSPGTLRALGYPRAGDPADDRRCRMNPHHLRRRCRRVDGVGRGERTTRRAAHRGQAVPTASATTTWPTCSTTASTMPKRTWRAACWPKRGSRRGATCWRSTPRSPRTARCCRPRNARRSTRRGRG